MRGSDVAIVLVRPARAQNVAAACRAMKNMGLRDLRLVDPPEALRGPESRALAYGAWDVLDAARDFPDLGAALASATLVVGTSGKAPATALTPRELARDAASRPGRLAVVFGPEASGLTTAELRLCHATVRIPAAADQPSLNLAQAVLVVSYELFLTLSPGELEPPGAQTGLATTGEVEAALEELKGVLLAAGYLDPRDPERILAEGRALLSRAQPTPREVALLRGLARQLAWAVGRAGASKHGDG